MARKKENTENKRYRIMKKLYEFGCRSEKELLSLSLETVLKMENITVSDMVIILEIQKSVKTHTLYSYLGGDYIENNIIQ